MGFCLALRGALTYFGDCGTARGLDESDMGIEDGLVMGGLSDGG